MHIQFPRSCICMLMYEFALIWAYTNMDSICMYVQVHACISTFLHVWCWLCRRPAAQSACKIICERICMYMFVFVNIWRMCTYIVRMCMYFLLWPPTKQEPMPPPQNTVPLGCSQWAPLRAPQSIWASTFFRHRQHFADPILRTPPLSTRPEPLKHPSAVSLQGIP